jgi:ABC-2 type transport system permease protein
MFTVVLFMSPILTMRLLPEDRRLKIDRQLFSSPVSRGAIVAGKYFSAAFIYAIAIAGTLSAALAMSRYGKPEWPVIVGNYIGLLFVGCALISICMFLSSFTESQFIAAIAGFGVSLMTMLLDSLSLRMGGGAAQDLLLSLSFNSRYGPFAAGVFDIGGAVFFVSAAALFASLTAASLERRAAG